MTTNLNVSMVTMEITVRNKMTASPATIVRLIKMATTLVAAHHLGLECTAYVLNNDMKYICFCIELTRYCQK